MFPIELDGARVLYYTPQDDYGAIEYPNGEVADYYHCNDTKTQSAQLRDKVGIVLTVVVICC